MIAIKGNNLSAEQILGLIKVLKGGQGDKKAGAQAQNVFDTLPNEKQQQVKSILQDKEKLQSVLNSPEVRDLLKKYGK